MGHYDKQQEEQLNKFEEDHKRIVIDKTIIGELLTIFGDTKTDCNITFRGFLLGNYTEEALQNDFPILYSLLFNQGVV